METRIRKAASPARTTATETLILRLDSYLSTHLIHNQISDSLEIRRSLLEVINQTPRSRNENLNSVLQCPNLAAFGNTAVDHSVLDSRGRTKLVTFLLDLDSYKRINKD